MQQDALEPNHYKDFRLFLQEELVRRCRKNSSYSLRAFAKTLSIHHATLSQILAGKRALSAKTVMKLGLALGLEPTEVKEYISGLSENTSGSQTKTYYQNLDMDAFKVIADWYHFGILELVSTKSFQPDFKWVAKRLGLTVSEVKIAVERLTRLDLLEISEKGRWIDVTGGFTNVTNPEFTTAARKKFQRQILEKSLEALRDVPIEKRVHSGITMAINAKKIPEAREKIKNFRRELQILMGADGNCDEVYQLTVSLFPLTNEFTQIGEKNENEL